MHTPLISAHSDQPYAEQHTKREPAAFNVFAIRTISCSSLAPPSAPALKSYSVTGNTPAFPFIPILLAFAGSHLQLAAHNSIYSASNSFHLHSSRPDMTGS